MKVTNVNLKKVEEQGAVKGYATIILDDSLAIHNIRLIESKDKMFIAFPSQKGKDGKYYDYVHPIVSDLREVIEKAIIDKYNG